jgi:hypothetical protein
MFDIKEIRSQFPILKQMANLWFILTMLLLRKTNFGIRNWQKILRRNKCKCTPRNPYFVSVGNRRNGEF